MEPKDESSKEMVSSKFRGVRSKTSLNLMMKVSMLPHRAFLTHRIFSLFFLEARETLDSALDEISFSFYLSLNTHTHTHTLCFSFDG